MLPTYHKDFYFTCNVLLHYLVKVENTKKCQQIFTLNVTNIILIPTGMFN